MRRLPLADELPYRFYPPRLSRFWLWAGRLYIGQLMRSGQRVLEVDIAGDEHLAGLLGKGDGVLITPNHPDVADAGVVQALAGRVGTPFYFMAAYQLFDGANRWFLPRIGVFPVDREGSDMTAFRTGVGCIAGAENPLVIFPEGETYHTAGRLTPLRDGASAVAATALRKMPAEKTVWIVPAAISYRFLDGHDPMPGLLDLMDSLEARFTWASRARFPLVERIYHFGEGLLGLKELEYLGEHRAGPLPGRLAALAEHILSTMEDRLAGTRRVDTVPVRVKELRRACLDRLADPATTPEQAASLRRDLDALWAAIQCFSYPGDYIRACPSVERVAETLSKFDQDLRGVAASRPPAPRRAILRVGEPIDVRARIGAGKARAAIPALTIELESRLQALIDTIPPGRPLAPTAAEGVEATRRDAVA